MIIKTLSCERFAGLQDSTIRLDPGMNILLGKNESGKSTMADLMYHLFFRDVRIGKREVEDKAFADTYFPKGIEADGDIIDGSVTFQTEKGTYKLSKEWSFGGSLCRMTLPDGTRLSSETEIKQILSDILGYGKGIYDEVIFPSQKRRQSLLTALFPQGDRKKDSPDERLVQALASTVNKAVLETGGVALDQLEARLAEKIAQYELRWDDASQMPEGGRKRGLQNRWKNAGRVLEAYYALEAARELLKQTEETEQTVENLSAQFRDVRQQRRDAQEERDRFATVQSILQNRENLRQLLMTAQRQIRQMETDLELWPIVLSQKASAEKLSHELYAAQILELDAAVKELFNTQSRKQEELDALGIVTRDTLRDAQELNLSIRTNQAKLQGMNLSARIRRFSDTDIQVTAAASGTTVPVEGDSFSITEAVTITVPDVLQLQLMPKGIDLDALQMQLTENRNKLAGILQENRVNSLEELRQNMERGQELAKQIQALNQQIQVKLGALSLEELKAAAASVTAPDRLKDALRAELMALCGNISADKFIGQKESQLQNLQQHYGSQEQLKDKLASARQEAEGYRRKLEDADQVPDAYQRITDPDRYFETLKQNVLNLENTLEKLEDKLRSAQPAADAPSAEDCREICQDLEERFAEEKRQLYRWRHIREVFLELKEQEKQDPTQDISQHFREYLSILTDHSLEMTSMDEKLQATFTSGHSRLTHGTLSEGTKDTIGLAFRLAMLEHLYPQGGAVAVFDDPFTDMDPSRTRQACALLQHFARNNQVLFITCDEKYLTLLSGKELSLIKD